ncbi:hypothetical protein H5410_033139 [Solanum commersonii]|uniref:Uncharacterized protein n=1 Tax=Solanum commersonii TaxID=4109 RepID=A0A9J5YMY4_SOLCO|nr:hypothetical protein H5410_033139 [Solanum commersonii]
MKISNLMRHGLGDFAHLLVSASKMLRSCNFVYTQVVHNSGTTISMIDQGFNQWKWSLSKFLAKVIYNSPYCSTVAQLQVTQNQLPEAGLEEEVYQLRDTIRDINNGRIYKKREESIIIINECQHISSRKPGREIKERILVRAETTSNTSLAETRRPKSELCRYRKCQHKMSINFTCEIDRRIVSYLQGPMEHTKTVSLPNLERKRRQRTSNNVKHYSGNNNNVLVNMFRLNHYARLP